MVQTTPSTTTQPADVPESKAVNPAALRGQELLRFLVSPMNSKAAEEFRRNLAAEVSKRMEEAERMAERTGAIVSQMGIQDDILYRFGVPVKSRCVLFPLNNMSHQPERESG